MSDENPAAGTSDGIPEGQSEGPSEGHSEGPSGAQSDGSSGRRSDVLLGTLDLMVLKLLEVGPAHGWGLAQRLEKASDGTFRVNQGSLYPALQRLKRKGMVKSRWGRSENGRRARYYELTSPGVRQLADEITSWMTASRAVSRVLAFEGEGA